MSIKPVDVNSQTLSQLVVKALQDKKGEDIVILDLRGIAQAVADFFVIATGSSDTHLQALMDSVEKTVAQEAGQTPWHIEGRERKLWVLMDYVDVVVHLFQRQTREYYALEELWADAPTTFVED
ncbi:MAG: ribosomal silencing factor RsfS [Thermonema sp.]|uniref:ribosome silencing factor n=1 Tax=Thermonema sp. TaxID=2231181 RepID=UPI0021DCB5CA|nr:ribosome silencing factor [Thermonema sp.]GIV38614.1 MAG: ribosomal silencing factor RsfS [Thermonema sp.]